MLLSLVVSALLSPIPTIQRFLLFPVWKFAAPVVVALLTSAILQRDLILLYGLNRKVAAFVHTWSGPSRPSAVTWKRS